MRENAAHQKEAKDDKAKADLKKEAHKLTQDVEKLKKKAKTLLDDAKGQGLLAAYIASAAFYMDKDAKLAFNDSRFSADRKVPRGSMLLAQCHEYGRGTKKDPLKALEIYWALSTTSTDPAVKAEAKKKIDSLFGNKEYQEELIKRLKDRAENGSAEEKRDAQIAFAELYLNGLGVEKDAAKVVEYYLEAKAYDKLADLMKKGIEAKVIAENLQKDLGKIKDLQIHYDLAKLLISGGKGVPADLKTGGELLKKTANAGHPQAAYEMGCYSAQEASVDLLTIDKVPAGLSVPRSPAEAMKFFRKAAEGGHPAAQYRYARALLMAAAQGSAKKASEGAPDKSAEMKKYLEDAEFWLGKAATEKYVPALFLYPMVVLKARAETNEQMPSLLLADLLKKLRASAEAGYPHAMFAMGDIAAAAGKEDEAREWYEKAAAKRYLPALIQLGMIKGNEALIHEYAARKYIPAEAEEARLVFMAERNAGKGKKGVEMLKKLRERKYPVGLNELAIDMYGKDKAGARKLFAEAAKSGSVCAVFNQAVCSFKEIADKDAPYASDVVKALKKHQASLEKLPKKDPNFTEILEKVNFAKLKQLSGDLRTAKKLNNNKEESLVIEWNKNMASLEKTLDWMVEFNYSWIFHKQPPEIRYLWTPAVDLSPLKEVFK